MKFSVPLYQHQYLRAGFLAMCLFVGGSLSAQSVLENTQLRFFTDAGFKALRDSTKEFKPEFQSGGIEMLITAQITDKISLLAEPVLRPDGTVSMERAMIKYSFNNYLNISAGRLYVPLGLWNSTFFRFAKALTPTIDAPQIIANPDEGGAAVNKDNGIMVGGDDISKVRFGYRFMVSNGRENTNSKDKYYVANVFIEPIDNLRLSVTQTSLKISNAFVGTARMKEIIFSCMYMGDKNLELAYELFRPSIKSDVMDGNEINIHYGYVGYKIKKTTPYIQYFKGLDIVNEEGGMSATGAILGVRYNFTPLAVFKAEVQLLEKDDLSKVNQIKLQWAIGF